MYRIIESRTDNEIRYIVQKKRRCIIPRKWRDCKLKVFYGYGTIVYKASFATRNEAEEYIKHKGSIVNALIPGFRFYQD